MPLYNFKRIAPVPAAKDFIDIVLSRTQRKTPTQCHAGWGINRIRQFYMRKVKYTQQTWHDKLTRMLDEFPRLDNIHPFYADLCNVLYDRSHYKLALGQINMARQLIDNIAKDYVRLMKYADSQYRAKQLKRAALGRMCTLMKKLNASLGYLEEVRKHLSRLPSIDPNTRTLIVCGYPNVGKSSFMNKVTRADVDVQPYAFTTKSLFVGHMDYKYLRWQVIDTPGILDHPLEERNTIEMCAITALAHLQCTVLYFIDPSETCGYSVQQQMSLFNSIKPLFANKPLMVVYTKTDLKRVVELPEEDRKEIEKWHKEQLPESGGFEEYQISSHNEQGVTDVKLKACDLLLEQRVGQKLRGKKLPNVLNRLTVANPTPRDDMVREATIPDAVMAKGNGTAMDMDDDDDGASSTKKTQKDIMWEQGGPGMYMQNLREHWQLKNDAWKTDAVPEIMDGKNIADFVDPDILEKLEALEKEEEALENAMDDSEEESDLDEEDQRLVDKIRSKRKVIVARHRRNKGGNRTVVQRNKRTNNEKTFKKNLEKKTGTRVTRALSRGRKRERSVSRKRSGNSEAMKYVDGKSDEKDSRGRSLSRADHRSKSKVPRDLSGMPKDLRSVKKARKMLKQSQKKMNILARAGESDRHIAVKMPKHLFSGKIGSGTRDRR